MTKDSMEPLTGSFLKTCSRVAWPGGCFDQSCPFSPCCPTSRDRVPLTLRRDPGCPFPSSWQHRQAQHAGHFICFDFST